MTPSDAKISLDQSKHLSWSYDLPCLQNPVQLKMSHYEKLSSVKLHLTVILAKLVSSLKLAEAENSSFCLKQE